MVDSITLDLLDMQLLNALYIDGRAPFSRIATVLGSSDRTITRRYRLLCARGALRVTGRTAPAAVGEMEWFVRIKCVPDTAGAVAAALARRDDTGWVSLNSGGAEIICTIRTGSDSERDSLLLQKLPRTPHVMSMSAHYVLHQFAGGPHGWAARLNVLAEQQASLLRAARPCQDPIRQRVELTGSDQAMFAVLARDGRATCAELAAACGKSEPTVRRRLDSLQRAGVLFFAVDVDARLFGLTAEAVVWLNVEPSELDKVGRALATHCEIPFAAATTGPTNLVAIAVCLDSEALYHYLTERLGQLKAVRQVESTPRMRYLKRAGQPVARQIFEPSS